MKIQAKVAKVLKRTRNTLCVSVVQKINNRYFYTTQISNNLSKSRIKTKKIEKRQSSKNISSIKSRLESQILQNQVINYLQPFLVTDAQLPHIVIPEQLEVAIHEGQEIGYKDNIQYYRIKTQQLLESMKPNNCKDLKLNFSIPQMELKSQQYQTPALVSKFFHQLHKVNLWMYFGKRFTDWHYDGHDNFLYVLEGRKYVYMSYHINIKSNNVYSLFNNHSQYVDQEKIPIIKAVVKKGECLFIPKGWWHKVVTQGTPSIAVNFWGNSISKIIQNFTQIQKTLVLKSLLFDVATECCKNFVPGWQNLQQKQMEDKRKSMGKQILELL